MFQSYFRVNRGRDGAQYGHRRTKDNVLTHIKPPDGAQAEEKGHVQFTTEILSYRLI